MVLSNMNNKDVNWIRNPDKKFLEKILKAIEENDGYCPCVLIKNEDTKCPCKDFRVNKKCHCKLYVEEIK